YVGTVATTLNPGAAYAVQSKTTQTLDIYGNPTQSQAYTYGNLSTPAKTYNYTYLDQINGNYAPRYILNRLTTATVTAGTVTSHLADNTYDDQLPWLQNSAWQHDDTNFNQNFLYRGNIAIAWSPLRSTWTRNFTTGVVLDVVNEQGVRVSNATSSGTNY